MKIIAISGKVGSGKDTTANILHRLLKERGYGVKSFAFADRLKQAVAFISGEDIGVFYSREGKDGKDNKRKLLNAVGKAIASVEKLTLTLSTYKDIRKFFEGKRKQVAIVTDLRLTHEYEYLMNDKDNDVVIIRLKGSFKPCPDEDINKSNTECDLDFLDDIAKDQPFRHTIADNVVVVEPFDVTMDDELIVRHHKQLNIELLEDILDNFNY